MAVDRAEVCLGAGDDDVGVGAPARIGAAVLLDADGDGSLGVDTLGYRLDVEVHQLRLGADCPVDGVADRVHRTVAGAGVGDLLAFWTDQLDSGGGNPLVAAGELDMVQRVTDGLAGRPLFLVHEDLQVAVGDLTLLVGQFFE